MSAGTEERTMLVDRVARQLAEDTSPLAKIMVDRYIGPDPLPPVAIITATAGKLKWFHLERFMEPVSFRENSAALTRVWQHSSGPVASLVHGVGGPSVDRLLITAMMRGVRAFIRIGTCGLTIPQATLGTVIIAEEATSDDTNFNWYLRRLAETGRPVDNPPFARADPELVEAAGAKLRSVAPPDRAVTGRMFSTSLIFRETPDIGRHYQELGCSGADMEVATVLACAQWYRIPAVGMLIGRDHILDGGFYTDQQEQFDRGVEAIRQTLDSLIPVARRAAARVSAEP